MFNNKQKIRDRLAASFGKVKEDSFYFELIEKYSKNKKKEKGFQVLSEKTCNDLDFQELFMFVDRTTSRVGQQFLYDTLRSIPSETENSRIQESLIAQITDDSDLRLNLQFELNKLVKDDTYYITTIFQEQHIKPPKWFFIIRLLSFTSLLSLVLLPFNPRMLFVLFGVFIINLGFHYWNKKNLNQYLGSIPQLLRLNEVAKVFMKTGNFGEVNNGIADAIAIIDKVRNRMSFFKMEAKIESDAEVLGWALLEFVKTLFLIEPLLLFGILNQLNTKRKEIENVFSFVGYIDSLISIASLRQGLVFYTNPIINTDNKKLDISEIYHPLIPDCVSNSISVNGKSILLTGSNMSGKTTFIRTIGVNVICGLTINTCFARQFSIPLLHVHSAIRISDDLLNSKSYYFEEVLTIKEMIDQSANGKANLFLLDEIFKGTNTIERISAGKAVLSALAKGGNIVFVSTHDIELTDLLTDEYELYHFSESVGYKTVDFDFKLKEGKLKNRNAIRILQINDYPEDIIIEAIELSKKLDHVVKN